MGGRGDSFLNPTEPVDPKRARPMSKEMYVALRKRFKTFHNPTDKDNFIIQFLSDFSSKETIPITNPSTGETRNVYQVIVGTIVVLYDSVTPAVRNLVQKLFEENALIELYSKAVEQIQVVPGSDPVNPERLTSSLGGFITIFNDRALDIGVLASAAGYNFARERWYSSKAPVESDYYAAIHSDEPPVSAYAYQSDIADFSEALRLYISSPYYLMGIAPKRFKIIRRMLRDPRYHG